MVIFLPFSLFISLLYFNTDYILWKTIVCSENTDGFIVRNKTIKIKLLTSIMVPLLC